MFIQSDCTSEWESNDDRELWVAFREGNRKALSTLFLRYYEKLFRYGMNLYPCEETIKDSIQQLFLRLWKKRKVLEIPESVSSYLFVSLRRVMFRNRERQAAMARRHDEFMQRTLGSSLNIENKMIVREEKEKREKLFQNALKLLTGRQKEALLLRLDSGQSNREIADIMGISDKRVRNLIYEATKRLKKHIYKSSN